MLTPPSPRSVPLRRSAAGLPTVAVVGVSSPIIGAAESAAEVVLASK